MTEVGNSFDLSGRVAVITGVQDCSASSMAGLLRSAGGVPVLVDIQYPQRQRKSGGVVARVSVFRRSAALRTSPSRRKLKRCEMKSWLASDVSISSSTTRPTIPRWRPAQKSTSRGWRIFPWRSGRRDIAVGLTGAFLCSKVFGSHMAANGGGVIVNVASDLALIAPDQRIYRQSGVPEQMQPVKPVTYSVVKSALVGLTRYLASYWADKKVRVNAISPGGVYNGQPEDFVARLTNLIPLGRMAAINEYQGAIVFLCSDASSYMTGTNLVIDGGRSCW